ncbi:MAG: PDZ domain-containing protein [Planctomycetota bacterium]
MAGNLNGFVTGIVALGMAATGVASGAETPSSSAFPRLVVEAMIDGAPVRLAADTCSQYSLLYRPAAKRLKLTVREPRSREPSEIGGIRAGMAGPCRVAIPGAEPLSATLAVVDAPPVAGGMDGLLGWSELQELVTEVDWARRSITVHPAVPAAAAGWGAWRLSIWRDYAAVEIQPGDLARGLVYLDTGSPYDVELSAARWREWTAANPGGAGTLVAFYSLADGFVVSEVRRAERLTLGPLAFDDVPVLQNDPGSAGWPNFAASVGLATMARYDMVFDGPGNRVLCRKRPSPAFEYPYNRMAAAFLPDSGGALVARVLPGGPAARAGVRDGDVLVRIGDTEVRNLKGGFRSDGGASGATVKLGLRRDGKDIDVMVTMEELPRGSS